MTQKIPNSRLKAVSEKAVFFILSGSIDSACQSLQSLLNIKCPFTKLDLVGRMIGEICRSQPQKLLQFCDTLIESQAMGGFVIVGSALTELLSTNLEQVMQRSEEYIIKGDKWYVCDIIGERSLGYALINHFEETLPWFRKFLQDENDILPAHGRAEYSQVRK